MLLVVQLMLFVVQLMLLAVQLIMLAVQLIMLLPQLMPLVVQLMCVSLRINPSQSSCVGAGTELGKNVLLVRTCPMIFCWRCLKIFINFFSLS